MKSRFFLPLPGLASPPHSHSQQLPEPFPSGVPRWEPRRQPRRQPRGEPRRVAHRHCQPGRWRRGRGRPRRRRRPAARPLQPAPEGVFRPQDSGLDFVGGRRGRRPPEGVRGEEVPPRRGGGRRRGLVFVTPSPATDYSRCKQQKTLIVLELPHHLQSTYHHRRNTNAFASPVASFSLPFPETELSQKRHPLKAPTTHKAHEVSYLFLSTIIA